MKKYMCGKGIDRMPDFAFRVMAMIFKFRDAFFSIGQLLEAFGIRKGQTVIDYGCGTGSYLRKASELVGEGGRVFALDIHELAVKAVKKRIDKEGLDNVTVLFAENGRCPLEDGTADLIYALDMFHMVGHPTSFLMELKRVSKTNGVLCIDNGHQSRKAVKAKIDASGAWKIAEENERFLKCMPVS